ncbi:MAG: DUF424 family protein [Candidatus Hodarchaeales archaeon]|jgi:hypothetical protein
MSDNSDTEDLATKQVYLKIHQRQNKVIYAFADPDMIGKTYTDGKGLKLVIRANFYKGKLIRIEDALDLLKRHRDSNIIGNLVKYAVMRGLIHKDCVLAFRDKETNKVVYHVMLMRL